VITIFYVPSIIIVHVIVVDPFICRSRIICSCRRVIQEEMFEGRHSARVSGERVLLLWGVEGGMLHWRYAVHVLRADRFSYNVSSVQGRSTYPTYRPSPPQSYSVHLMSFTYRLKMYGLILVFG